jgi:hypothetical protein
LGSFNAHPLVPVIKNVLETVSTRLLVVIFFSPDFVTQVNSPAKRTANFKPLQDLVSMLYLCTASRMDISTDVIFADWCGYDISQEVWQYSTLNVPEGIPLEKFLAYLPKHPRRLYLDYLSP